MIRQKSKNKQISFSTAYWPINLIKEHKHGIYVYRTSKLISKYSIVYATYIVHTELQVVVGKSMDY